MNTPESKQIILQEIKNELEELANKRPNYAIIQAGKIALEENKMDEWINEINDQIKVVGVPQVVKMISFKLTSLICEYKG